MNSPETLPVVFYNTENLFDTVDDRSIRGDDEFLPDGEKFWDEERYQRKIKHTVEAISLMKSTVPALIGLCEIENRKVLEDLLLDTNFATLPYEIVHQDSEDPRGMDCALIFDSSRLKCLQTTFHEILVPSDKYFRTRQIIEVHFQWNHAEMVVFVNHWPSRKEGQRVTQPRRIAAAQTLRKRVDALLKTNPLTNIIIMGDFNDTPNDNSLRETLRAKGQHELKAGDLVNLLIEEENDDLGTHIHQGDWMVFDQLIVSTGLLQARNNLEIVKNNAFIFKHESLLLKRGPETFLNTTYAGDRYVGGYSDHLPVYLNLKLKQKK